MVTAEKVNILVVDDQPAHLLSYEVILSDLGQNVVCARSGTEALQRLMEQDFAAILLDVNMPAMDGFEVATLIHQHPRFEETPIIFVTAMQMTDLDRLKGYAIGAIDYIHVPVIPSILRGKVAVLVDLYVKKRELLRVNANLARANSELAETNARLHAERDRDLSRLNRTLAEANAELERGNSLLQAEVAERRRAEAELAATKDDLARQVEALTRVHELAVFLAGSHSLPAALQSVVRTVVEAHGAKRGALALVDAATGTLQLAAQVGLEGPGLLPAETSVCRAAFQSGKRTIVEDVASDPALALELDTLSALGVRALHCTPIVTRSDQRIGVVTVLLDVARAPTPREVQIADMCARYAAESIDASRYQEVLRESEQRLREADRRKDEFLATLAHELRNPLAPIRNSLHVLRQHAVDRATADHVLDMVERQTNQMVRLVDELLEVSRITRGKIDLALESADLCEILHTAIETSAPLVDAARHELVVSLSQEPIPVCVDSVRMCQVFANLINNAAKYTPPGGHIALSARCERDQVTVSVRDDGVGIPEHMLARVFDMFTQIDRTLGRAQGGLGIGLTLVKRLVEMHRGRVEAHSAGLGSGSEFRVVLPLDHTRREADHSTRTSVDRRLAIRVLVVDDNHDAADSLSILLRSRGAEVCTAHGGHEALDAMESFDPAVVLLDLGMPDMNGFEVARKLRADARWRDVTLIALTGWGQPEDRRKSQESGFDLHLVKPIGLAELERLLVDLEARRSTV